MVIYSNRMNKVYGNHNMYMQIYTKCVNEQTDSTLKPIDCVSVCVYSLLSSSDIMLPVLGLSLYFIQACCVVEYLEKCLISFFNLSMVHRTSHVIYL